MTYQTEITTQLGTQIKTVASNKMELPKNGVTEISFTPEKMGIDFVEVDATQIVFAEEAKQIKEDNKDADIDIKNVPRFITGTLKQGNRSYLFKIDQNNKLDPIIWPVAIDNNPIIANIIAKSYQKSPLDRKWFGNEIKDIKEAPDRFAIYLRNEDFK